jgi:hypothetical protein
MSYYMLYVLEWKYPQMKNTNWITVVLYVICTRTKIPSDEEHNYSYVMLCL